MNIPDEMRIAAEERATRRAVERALRSNIPHHIQPSQLAIGQVVLAYISSGSQGRNVWRSFKISKVTEHGVYGRVTHSS